MKRQNPRIAIQGIAASFHEAAAMACFAAPIRTVECLTFHELCDALDEAREQLLTLNVFGEYRNAETRFHP